MHSQKRDSRLPRLLVAILIGFAALSLVYSSVTRLKRGPDEPAHFIYIRSLATTYSPPPIAHTQTHTEDSVATHEGHQPPLYYALMAVPYAVLNACGVTGDTIWRVLRILGIGIGVFWIYWVYGLALEYFGRRSYALATAGFVALIPNAAYTAGVVNNDVLIALLFTWAMVPILRLFRTQELTARDAGRLGFVMGLAILTKAQGLLLVPVLLIAAVAVCRRSGYANLTQIARVVGVALGTALLVSGWWFVRCRMLYGTFMPHSLYSPVLPHGMIDLLMVPESAFGLVWLCSCNLYSYFWTPFWLVWKYVTWGYYFWPIFALNLVLLAGLVPQFRRSPGDRRSLWLLIFTVFATWATWLDYALTVDRMSNLQGRWLMPVAGAIGIILMLGADGWLKSPRAKKIGLVAGAAVMLVANAAVIACIVAYYASGAA